MTTFTNEISCMVHNYDLDGAIHKLDQGGLILYPTDTIWGIGCDATNPTAVSRVYDLKKRDHSKSFVILVDSIHMLKQYVDHLHPRIETLLLYHLRPLTVIYNQGVNLAENASALDGSVAIRIVKDPFCRALINTFDRPLIATSANINNEPFPANFGEVSSEIIQGVDYVVKHRQHEKGLGQPSVIVRLSDRDELIFIRE